MPAFRDLFAIGASLGGVEALRRVVAQLPADFAASVFVVQHTAAGGRLDEVLGRLSKLPVRYAMDGERFEPGTIHLARADRHLLVEGKQLRTVRGPRENGVRPAIDPLFRSLAAHYGPRAVGIVLTGLRDDGTAGLQAIRRAGGVTVVQDPDDAAHPEMPRSVLAHFAADHVLPVARMGELMERLAREPAPEGVEPPADVVREARITARYGKDEKAVSELGALTALDCPECGGALWELHDEGRSRFRCYVGHAYSQPALVAEQADQAERSLLVALRTLEERARLLHRLSEQGRERSDSGQEGHFARERDETLAHAEVLRELLASLC